MVRWIRKRLALRSYRRRLGPALAKRYGRQKHYTIQQVRKTVELLGLNLDYACYAYAAYCERNDFTAHHEALGESCDWTEMREAMGASHGWSLSDGYADGDDAGGHDDSHHHDHGHHDHDGSH